MPETQSITNGLPLEILTTLSAIDVTVGNDRA